MCVYCMFLFLNLRLENQCSNEDFGMNELFSMVCSPSFYGTSMHFSETRSSRCVIFTQFHDKAWPSKFSQSFGCHLAQR